MVIGKRNPHIDVRSSVGAGLGEQCGLDFRAHSFACGTSLCSVQPGQLDMEVLNERETRKDRHESWKTKDDHSRHRHRPNTDTSEWRANRRPKPLIAGPRQIDAQLHF